MAYFALRSLPLSSTNVCMLGRPIHQTKRTNLTTFWSSSPEPPKHLRISSTTLPRHPSEFRSDNRKRSLPLLYIHSTLHAYSPLTCSPTQSASSTTVRFTSSCSSHFHLCCTKTKHNHVKYYRFNCSSYHHTAFSLLPQPFTTESLYQQSPFWSFLIVCRTIPLTLCTIAQNTTIATLYQQIFR